MRCPNCESEDTESVDGVYVFQCNECGHTFTVTAGDFAYDEDYGQDR
jgi:ribosomal protein L37AE/L43A